MDDNYPEPESEPEVNNEIDDFLNTKLEEKKEEDIIVSEKNILEKLEEKVPVMVVIVFSFFILSLPKLNSLIVRFIPKLSSEGGLSLIGIAIKSLIMGIIYLVSSIFI